MIKQNQEKQLLMFLIFLFIVGVTLGCHPECRYACDDPVCLAVCETVCELPACEFNQTCGYSPSCSVRCPPDMCESDTCPQCETICSPPPSPSCGDILCEATVCAWRCRKPTEAECRKPICELQCEQPACEYAGVATLGVSIWLILFLFIMICL